MSSIYKKAKKWYDKGLWSKEDLKRLVQMTPQQLTEAEYEDITGEPYEA